jgi:hypothetical protein
VELKRYHPESEKEAELFSLQPVLYYLMIIDGGLSYFAFLAAKIPSQ